MRLLSTKIFAGYLIIIIVLTGLILYFSFKTIRTHYLDFFARDLKNINLTLQPEIRQLIQQKKIYELDSTVKKIGSEIHTRITIIDKSGVVLADSQNDPEKMENHKKRPEVVEALNDKTGQSLRYSTTVKDEMLYVAIPIKIDGNIAGVSRSSYFLSEINTLLFELRFEILEVAFIVVFLSLIGVLIFSRNISSPINKLSSASKRVAEGDFETKVKITSRDELKDLSDNFNFMTKKLKELFLKVTSQKEELTSLFTTIREGLVVLSKEGIVLHANKGFKKIVKQNNVIGLNYLDIIKEKKFKKIFKEISKRRSAVSREIQISGQFFIISSNFIETKDEIVLLLHDVTEIKKLEEIKKDFVVNVSHELRTPLTALKGFAETLADELTDEQHKYYSKIIVRHTNRLIHIVQDLLTLSELEHAGTKLMFTDIDLKETFDNVSKIFIPKLVEKKLTLKLNVNNGIPKIQGDQFRLEQVFINLIDNAIKYTDIGGVTINVDRMGEYARISIKDTGLGIPEEDQRRIFERFYIVDKSRSRRVGGTGLGLSIAKHIIILHDGEIELFSKKGQGTEFVITLPITQPT